MNLPVPILHTNAMPSGWWADQKRNPEPNYRSMAEASKEGNGDGKGSSLRQWWCARRMGSSQKSNIIEMDSAATVINAPDLVLGKPLEDLRRI